MHPHRSAAPRRTPPPDVLSSQRGAYPAHPPSNARPDVLGSHRAAYPPFANSPPLNNGHLQHVTSPYTAPLPHLHCFQHSHQPADRHPAPGPHAREAQPTFNQASTSRSPPRPRPPFHDAQHRLYSEPPSRPQRAQHPPSPPHQPHPNAYDAHPAPDASRAPEFTIIGLFAVRLAVRLISQLPSYPQRNSDMSWLETFLAPYPAEYALAKVSGARREEYVVNYEGVVGRMKKQARYPVVFMGMNPDRESSRRGSGGDGGRSERDRVREMTDLERLDIIDFCDAAGEWGSVVPIPAKEADRMIELAEQRKIADLEGGREERSDFREERYGYEERRR